MGNTGSSSGGRPEEPPRAVAAQQLHQPSSSGDGVQHHHRYDYVIEGGPAFSELVVVLRPGQAILADGGALQHMRGGIERGQIKLGSGGVLSALGRAFGGESLLLNRYVAKTDARDDERRIAFASPFPGDALCLELAPGDEWTLSRGAFLASSEAMQVTGKLNMRGIVPFGQEEGLVLPKVRCVGDGGGTLFVSAYGGCKKHELRHGDELLVDNGLFLACPGSTSYQVVKLGKTLVSSLFGREGLGMRFVGPCTVYTQSRNFNDLVAELADALPGCRHGGGAGARTRRRLPKSVEKKDDDTRMMMEGARIARKKKPTTNGPVARPPG